MGDATCHLPVEMEVEIVRFAEQLVKLKHYVVWQC